MSDAQGVRMPQGAIMEKLVKSKVLNGFQVEVVSVSGESYWGFVAGFDGETVKLYVSGYGEDSGPGIVNYREYETNPVDVTRYNNGDGKRAGGLAWIPFRNIEAIYENGFGWKHLSQSARDEIAQHIETLYRKAGGSASGGKLGLKDRDNNVSTRRR